MTVRVDVSHEILAWAQERSGIEPDLLSRRFPKLTEWETGEVSPTLKQLESFARATHTPIGYLFLEAPPVDAIPIPDYRTIADAEIGSPSPDLLDTIYQCQQRQEWYRQFALSNHLDASPLVGVLTVDTAAERAADWLREMLAFGVEERGNTWAEAFRRLSDGAEAAGVLVMVSGVVGSNTHRKLDTEEFRGFSLVDTHAPVVFINGTDTRAGQIFTLVHELGHIVLGQSALDDVDVLNERDLADERWCNQLAAEVLIPREDLAERLASTDDPAAQLDRLARAFKVSTLAILNRMHDTEHLVWDRYRELYEEELTKVLAILEQRPGDGGNFYNTQPVRVSKRFARALIASTLEGQTLHTDAFRMLGFKKHSTFKEMAHRLGVA